MFIERFATAEGRIVDTGNAGISHTEGQGIGLLTTAMFGQEEVFLRLLDWTERTLRHRDDSLHAWQYLHNANVRTPDGNPATDGELLIAHALFVAGRRWGRPDYTTAGHAIARDVAEMLVGEVQGRQVLLPGLCNDQQAGHVVINPSYYLFPTLRHIAAETGAPAWRTLHDDGLSVLREARFGRWGLPADWISLPRGSAGCMIAPGRHASPTTPFDCRFTSPGPGSPTTLPCPALRSALAFWSEAPGGAAWTDLRSNAVAPYALTPGMRAIRDYVRARVGLASTMSIPSIRLAPPITMRL